MSTNILCYHCGSSLLDIRAQDFRATCPSCDVDLHCCKQCLHYDQDYYNECRETMAERVVNKQKANYCEYFRFASGQGSTKPSQLDAKSKLEALFKK